MKEYVMLYRSEQASMPKLTPEQTQEITKKWMEWIGNINAKGKLVDRGNRLEPGTGRVVKPSNLITNGPYAEIKETIGGFSIVRAESFEEVVEIAKGCPGLTVGGSVEIREVSNLS